VIPNKAVRRAKRSSALKAVKLMNVKKNANAQRMARGQREGEN